MLKSEIDELENINQLDSFLENTKCGFLLEELQNVPEIKLYFKKVIIKTIEKIERTCSFREINFKVSEILKQFNALKKEEENNLKEVKNNNLDEYYKNIINRQLIDLSINFSKEENNLRSIKNNIIFIEKYSPDIITNDIEARAKKAKEDNKEYLFQYFNKLNDDIKSKEDLYSNSTLMKNVLDTNSPPYIFLLYQNNFLEVISFIEILIEDLMENILLLPNSIKYICKIISVLIRNKFKDISKIEENAFISKFIINKLLIPFISSPSFKAVISDFVISGNTIKNLKTINIILKKLFSGKLFLNNLEEGDYTPFNWFFMEHMDKILNFFEKTIKVNLPNFIEQYINNKLPKDYHYEFFNENKEQICSYISICFNYKNLYYLTKGFKKGDTFFTTQNPRVKQLKSSLGRLEKSLNEIRNVHQKKIMEQYKENMKSNEKNKNQENIEVDIFYLYNNLEIEKKYNYLFSINNLIANFFIDKENEEKKAQLSENEKNIMKVKNYLCKSLGNYRILDKSDFNIGSISSIIKMLNDIKICMSLPTFILNNNTIPSIWYINSLLEYLNKMPEDYKENDFEKLFNELKEDLNRSIKNLDFQILILFRNKLKFIDKINNYYENEINNILINEKIKKIAEEIIIPVEITFIYEKEVKKFELIKSNVKDKILENRIVYEIPNKNITIFKTIEAFTRYFPNLAKYQKNQDVSPFNIIKELSINTKIKHYFDIIKETVMKLDIDTQYMNLYQEKIKNYIMNKLFDKIYPCKPSEMDNEIFRQSIILSNVEPKSIINKDYIFDIMLPDILNEFKEIDIARTPYKKLECIYKVFKYIENLIKFNEGEDKEIGADDIGPVLLYILIKSHPLRINTDIEFIRIFLNKNNINEEQLTNIEATFDSIINGNLKINLENL